MFKNKKRQSILYAKIVPSNEMPRTVTWLIKRRIVRNSGQANILLLLLIVGFSLAAYVVFPDFKDDRPYISDAAVLSAVTE